jgi:hypothetical protein
MRRYRRQENWVAVEVPTRVEMKWWAETTWVTQDVVQSRVVRQRPLSSARTGLSAR